MAVLQGFLLVFSICLIAYFLTNFWIRWAYRKCSQCRALNLPRRTQCRLCSHPFSPDS